MNALASPSGLSSYQGMTVFEVVSHNYQFPPHINPFKEQLETINDLAPLEQQGHFLDMGVGKTFTATCVALYLAITQGIPTIVVMPPLLIPQWHRWLLSIKPGLSVTALRGTPAKRSKLSLDVDFVLVGIQIFKRDIDRLREHYSGKRFFIIGDEATEWAWIESKQHELMYDFTVGQPRAMLTGTPLNKPLDCYGLMKFTAPGVFRNYEEFKNLHVSKADFYGRPTEYRDLEDLHGKLLTNAKRFLYEDVFKDVEQPLYVPIDYDLEPDHQKLYVRLAENELLKLPEGGKIDATDANRLLHALGQIVINYDYFSGKPEMVSNTIGLIEEQLKQLNGKKLVVFAHYKMSVSLLVRHFGERCAGGINSEASHNQKEKSIQAFINDPAKTIIVIQVKSGGKGLDGLQHVCNHCMFVEPCTAPRDFHQAVARLKRTGQRLRVWVGIAIATKTLQVRKFSQLLENDEIVNQVIRNVGDLKAMLHGN